MRVRRGLATLHVACYETPRGKRQLDAARKPLGKRRP